MTSRKLAGRKLPAHPGNARYRIAAGAGPLEKKAGRIYFSGGTDNPYNYNGIGYNGQPAEPSPVTFAFNVHTRAWETVSDNTPEPTMDHRGLLVTRRGLVIVGRHGKRPAGNRQSYGCKTCPTGSNLIVLSR